jgi:dihydroxyacetone kinase-like predicted kinase
MKNSKKNVNQNQLNSDYEWLLLQGISQYKGQWIAVLDRTIIARNKLLKNVLKTVAGKNLNKVPLYLRVPKGTIIR